MSSTSANVSSSATTHPQPPTTTDEKVTAVETRAEPSGVSLVSLSEKNAQNKISTATTSPGEGEADEDGLPRQLTTSTLSQVQEVANALRFDATLPHAPPPPNEKFEKFCTIILAKKRRGLTQRHVQFIAIGGVIGSSYFLGLGYLIGKLGPATGFGFLLGGLIVYAVTAALGELSLALPISGSFVSFSSILMTPAWGCGIGWSYFISWVVYIPSECVAAGMIIESLFPGLLPQHLWAALFGLVITSINALGVGLFGEIEFWLALFKVCGILSFSVVAALIFLGVVPNCINDSCSHNPIGSRYILDQGGLFPNGLWVVCTNMVMVLVNFQGSEIIGLSVSETQNPERTIPAVVRGVSFRILLLFVVPAFLVVSIFPWTQGSVEGSIFATSQNINVLGCTEALDFHHLTWLAIPVRVVTLFAALSCANSGFFGSVRALRALSEDGMAPKFLRKLSSKGVPVAAMSCTVALIWSLLIPSYFMGRDAYAKLLVMSGFTGAMCWISICICQLRLRWLLRRRGYGYKDLSYAPWYLSGLTCVSIVIQAASLMFLLFDPTLGFSFFIGVGVFLIPTACYALMSKKYFPQHNSGISPGCCMPSSADEAGGTLSEDTLSWRGGAKAILDRFFPPKGVNPDQDTLPLTRVGGPNSTPSEATYPSSHNLPDLATPPPQIAASVLAAQSEAVASAATLARRLDLASANGQATDGSSSVTVNVSLPPDGSAATTGPMSAPVAWTPEFAVPGQSSASPPPQQPPSQQSRELGVFPPNPPMS